MLISKAPLFFRHFDWTPIGGSGIIVLDLYREPAPLAVRCERRRHMHVRFVNAMLISPNSVPSDELFEHTDSYYVYLKPWNVDDREILKATKFDGPPPLWIGMPPH